MLDLITAVRFDGRVQSGRTVPCRLTNDKLYFRVELFT